MYIVYPSAVKAKQSKAKQSKVKQSKARHCAEKAFIFTF
jgi:hypothetical protein